jgi:hypothetical protein
MNKTHYRKASKSDHLAKEDLIGLPSPIIYKINHCQFFENRKVSGTNCKDSIIAFFEDPSLKPWKIPVVAQKIIIELKGGNPWVEDWTDFELEFYIDNTVKMMKSTVGGVRVRKVPVKDTMNEASPHWQTAINNVQNLNWTIAQIREYYQISDEDYRKLCESK